MFELIHLLTSDPTPPPLLDSMIDLYIAKRRFDLENVIWSTHYFSPPMARHLNQAYELLPDAARFSYLLSPSTYEAVHSFRHKPLESCDLLISYAYDQLSVVQGVPANGYKSDKQEIWSPTGGEALIRSSDGWTLKPAVRLDSLVVIDLDSPFARMIRQSPLMARPAEDFSDTERDQSIMKLQAAFEYVDRVAPTFGRLIRNYTRAARVRKCVAFKDVSSEHVTDTIGEIRLMNVHQDAYTIPKVAEALVHESVHNLLSTYEYLHGPFLLTEDDRNYRPVSPWSGNPIPVGSFCHAVFVWFSLYNFALRELQQSGLSEEKKLEIQRRRNLYASGFMAPTPLSHYLRDLGLLNRQYLPTIDRIQDVVQGLDRGYVHEPMEETAIAV